MKVVRRTFASVAQRRAAGLAVCAFAVCAPGSGPLATEHNAATFVQDGKAGFVVTEIQYALGLDAEQAGACPDGMTEGMRRDGPGGYGSGAPGAGQRPAGTPPPSGQQGAAGAPPSGQRPEGAPLRWATTRRCVAGRAARRRRLRRDDEWSERLCDA